MICRLAVVLFASFVVGCQQAPSGEPVAAAGPPAGPATSAAKPKPTAEKPAPENVTAEKPLEPATPAEAAKVLDLRTFPRLKPTEDSGRASLARLFYATKESVPAAFAFQQKTLVGQGWKELPNSSVSDQSASGNFMRSGYRVSVMVYPNQEQSNVSLIQHGNVDVSKLPTPPNVKPLYQTPGNVAYVTEAPVEETAAAVRKLLTDLQWTPYGDAGDSVYYRQNAVQLSARVLSAPGQGGKTVLEYSTELLSVALPAPEDAIGLQYSEPPIQLHYDTPKSMKEVYAYYKETLASASWEPTTEAPVKIDFRYFVIFRDKAKDLIDVQLSEFEGKTRVKVTYQTKAEVDELDRQMKAELDKKKAEAEKPKTKPKLTIKLPAGATDASADDSEIKFSVAAGKAKDAVQTVRKQLLAEGFKEESAAFEPMFGTVMLRKGDVSVTLLYVDTGVLAPEITITVFGAEVGMSK